MLNLAKRVAVERLENDRDVMLEAFRGVLKQRYAVPPDRIHFDCEDATRRVWGAVYLGYEEAYERREELLGETDGDTIWVVRMDDFETLVQTLVHEALHDSAFITLPTRGGVLRGLGCEDEHRVIDRVIF